MNQTDRSTAYLPPIPYEFCLKHFSTSFVFIQTFERFQLTLTLPGLVELPGSKFFLKLHIHRYFLCSFNFTLILISSD